MLYSCIFGTQPLFSVHLFFSFRQHCLMIIMLCVRRILASAEVWLCFRPDGRIDRRTDVPKEPMSWVVGAFSISNEHGLGVMPQPYRVCPQGYFPQLLYPTVVCSSSGWETILVCLAARDVLWHHLAIDSVSSGSSNHRNIECLTNCLTHCIQMNMVVIYLWMLKPSGLLLKTISMCNVSCLFYVAVLHVLIYMPALHAYFTCFNVWCKW